MENYQQPIYTQQNQPQQQMNINPNTNLNNYSSTNTPTYIKNEKSGIVSSSKFINVTSAKSSVSVQQLDGTEETVFIKPQFYNQISIFPSINEPKFKLIKNKFNEFKNELINHSRKYGYHNFIMLSTPQSWRMVSQRYPSAVNPHLIYMTYRTEMEKLFSMIYDTIKDMFSNLESLEGQLKNMYFRLKSKQQNADGTITNEQNYIDEITIEKPTLEDYTGDYYNANPHLLYTYIKDNFEPVQESAFAFTTVIKELINLKYQPMKETAVQYKSRFINQLNKLNKILLREQPRPGQLLPDTIQSALLLFSLPESHRNFDHLLFELPSIEPDYIFNQIIKRDEVERASSRNRSNGGDETYYTQSNGGSGNGYRNNYNNNKRYNNNNRKPYQNQRYNGTNSNNQNRNGNNAGSNYSLFSMGTALGGEVDETDYDDNGEYGENYNNENEYNDDQEDISNNNYSLFSHDFSLIDDNSNTQSYDSDEAQGGTNYALATQLSDERYLSNDDLRSNILILDSGSSAHINCNKHLLSNTKVPEYSKTITGLYGTKSKVSLVGDLAITKQIKLTNVSHVSNSGVNLASVSSICAKGCGIWFDANGASVYDRPMKNNQFRIMTFENKNGLYVMKLKSITDSIRTRSGFEYSNKPQHDPEMKQSSSTTSPQLTERKESNKPVRHIPKKAQYQSKGGTSKNNNGSTTNAIRNELLASRAANNKGSGGANTTGSGGTGGGNKTNTGGGVTANYAMEDEENDCCFHANVTNEPTSNIEDSDLIKRLIYLHESTGHTKLNKQILTDAGIHYDGDVNKLFRNCKVCIQSKLVKKATGTGTFDKPIDICIRKDYDVIGPFSTWDNVTKSKIRLPSIGGGLYILTGIDHAGDYGMIEIMKNKSEATDGVIKDIKLNENQFGVKVKTIFTDGGGEFVNGTMKAFCEENGIHHIYPPANSPSLNGKAERFNRSLVTIMKNLIKNCGGTNQLWAEAAHAALLIHNYTPRKSLNDRSPYEVMYNKKPDLKKLVPFGIDIEVLKDEKKVGKLDDKSITGTALVYNHNRLSYRILLPGNKIVHSRNVKILETYEQVKKINAGTSSDNTVTVTFSNGTSDSDTVKGTDGNLITETTITGANGATTGVGGVNNQNETTGASMVHNENDVTGTYDVTIKIEPSDDNSYTSASNASTTANTGTTETTIKEENYEASVNLPIQPLEPIVTNQIVSSRGRVITPVQPFNITSMDGASYAAIMYDNYLDERIENESEELEQCYLATVEDIIDEQDPITIKDIIGSPNHKKWLESMEKEKNSLLENKVIMVVPKPRDRKLIKTKWVYKVKKNHLNVPTVLKSRIVAKGYSQKYGLDYFDSYSPVVHFKSIKCLLALSANYGMVIHQLDFATAYLNSKLEEDLFIEIPKEINTENLDTNKYCYKLLKGLYGLKQSGLLWNKLLIATLLSLGYVQSNYDPCIFVKFIPGYSIPIIISIYVDDLIIYALPALLNIWLKDKEIIRSKFKIDDIGEINYCLKMKITNIKGGGIKVDQTAYINSILKQFNMLDCTGTDNPSTTIDLTNPDLFVDKAALLDDGDHGTYRRIIGKLLYLSNTTRVDITFAVNMLSRFLHAPTVKHLQAAYIILRYLKETSSDGLVYTGSKCINGTSYDNGTIKIECYTDSDWGTDKLSRASTLGFVLMINGNTIQWVSQRQKSISQSSAEAEFVAANAGARECIWFHSLLSEIFSNEKLTNQIKISLPLMKIDNQSCIRWITSDESEHLKSKHIDLRYKYIRMLHLEKKLLVEWCPTKLNLADLLTKRINTDQFNKLKSKLIN